MKLPRQRALPACKFDTMISPIMRRYVGMNHHFVTGSLSVVAAAFMLLGCGAEGTVEVGVSAEALTTTPAPSGQAPKHLDVTVTDVSVHVVATAGPKQGNTGAQSAPEGDSSGWSTIITGSHRL